MQKEEEVHSLRSRLTAEAEALRTKLSGDIEALKAALVEERRLRESVRAEVEARTDTEIKRLRGQVRRG